MNLPLLKPLILPGVVTNSEGIVTGALGCENVLSSTAPGQMRQLMVVHDDDPVNKYGYQMVLQPPWWMGPPATRPPMVPRETRWRPITSFVIATVDLKNGMNSKPGKFVRRGHDYRIEARLALQRSYGLDCTDMQADAIESALRANETEWAARRMIARKMDSARKSIASTLAKWGSPQIDVADIDPVPSTGMRDRRTPSVMGMRRIVGLPARDRSDNAHVDPR